ncbi:PaaX family transcriptional regulator C-terminal domain-containing protein [Micromonospora sp. NPDC005215]|uniref:PaaX family transcriptional regulator n=1 Tax=Micromonospora sp. NPDC005215 TaxID=3157024 RepID=UPI0033AF2C0A
MVSPFNIDEIFPDLADGSTQLPRRQSGSSPQGLAVTLLADYTIQGRTWLPSAALVALLAESGVNTAGARTAISRLARRGVLEISRQGRHSFYRLTQPAADDLARGARRIAAFVAQAEAWDGWWTLVAFSLPQEASAERRALRGQLRWLGYAPLYDGLWVSPHNFGHTPRAKLSAIALGATTVFRARHVEIEAVTHRIPIDAWDTAALVHDYDSFIRRWKALLTGVQTGDVTGAAAVRARTEVMDAYRRFPILDPLLPIELMPAGWPRMDARAVFVAVYDGLAEPAQEHVRAVAHRYATSPQPDIRAHRVDQLGDLWADRETAHLAAALEDSDVNS